MVNPLPAGMRDVLPPFAGHQSSVGRSVMGVLELCGFERVWLPTFEYARVLDRSRTAAGQSLRFVEPETGEVVALRSDMTPQIARVVSTRYPDRELPLRLCYQGSVLRRRSERARLESQTVQAGAELIGRPGPDGDAEVIEVMCDAIRAAQLSTFVLDIGHVGVAGALLSGVSGPARDGLLEALEAKDVTLLQQRARASSLPERETQALIHLPELHGGAEVWALAEKALAGTAALGCVAELRSLWERLADVAPEVVVDLGETRDLEYYSGVVFQVLAYGPGEPIASGGRYDGLHERFGQGRPAAGFAIDINHLGWALVEAGRRWATPARLVLPSDAERAVVRAFRAAKIECCTAADPARYAATWEGAQGLFRASQAGSWLLGAGEDGAEAVAAASEPLSALVGLVAERLLAGRAGSK